MRLDVWLDIACLFKTRSEAQKACKGGKVSVNGQAGKQQKELKEGDVIDITRPLGRRQRVVVRGFADQHIAKAEARKLYEDITPAPSPEEAELLRLARLARPHVRAAQAGAPSRDERRQLRKIKEGRGFGRER